MDKVHPELNNDNSKEYEIKVICKSKVYVNKSESYLPGLYYLVLWKGYLEEKNT